MLLEMGPGLTARRNSKPDAEKLLSIKILFGNSEFKRKKRVQSTVGERAYSEGVMQKTIGSFFFI